MSSSVTNGPFGGNGGSPWNIFPTESGLTLTSIEVWEGWCNSDYVVRAIQPTWSDGSAALAGTPSAYSKLYRFEEGENIQTMTIHAGAFIDNISFTTNQGGAFKAGGDGGSSNEVNVGNGQCVGFSGRAGACIDNISVDFQD